MESVLQHSKAPETKVQDSSSLPAKALQPTVLTLLAKLDSPDNLVKDKDSLDLSLLALHLIRRRHHLEVDPRVLEFPDKAFKVHKARKDRKALKVLVSPEHLNQDLQVSTITTSVLVPME